MRKVWRSAQMWTASLSGFFRGTRACDAASPMQGRQGRTLLQTSRLPGSSLCPASQDSFWMRHTHMTVCVKDTYILLRQTGAERKQATCRKTCFTESYKIKVTMENALILLRCIFMSLLSFMFSTEFNFLSAFHEFSFLIMRHPCVAVEQFGSLPCSADVHCGRFSGILKPLDAKAPHFTWETKNVSSNCQSSWGMGKGRIFLGRTIAHSMTASAGWWAASSTGLLLGFFFLLLSLTSNVAYVINFQLIIAECCSVCLILSALIHHCAYSRICKCREYSQSKVGVTALLGESKYSLRNPPHLNTLSIFQKGSSNCPIADLQPSQSPGLFLTWPVAQVREKPQE